MRIFSLTRSTVLLIGACVFALAAFLTAAHADDYPAAPPDQPATQPAGQPGDNPDQTPPEEEKLSYKYEGKTLTAMNPTGGEKWKRTLDSDIVSVVFEGKLLMAVTRKDVVLFTPISGIKRWAFPLPDVTKVQPHDSTVILSTATQVSVVDTESGKEDWKYRSPDNITAYNILDETVMVINSDKRVAAFNYDTGDSIAGIAIAPSNKFVDAQVIGPVLLLRFEKEVRLRNIVRQQELPDLKTRTIDGLRDADLPDALADLNSMVGAARQEDRAAGLAMLALAKDKDGKLLLAAGLESADKAIAQSAGNIIATMTGHVHDGTDFLKSTATGVLEQLSVLDAGGSIEKSFYTAYYTKYAYELPDPAQTLAALITLLRFGEKDMRECAIRTLESLTGNTFDFKSGDSLRKRDKAIEVWRKWLADNQGKFEWDIPGRKILVRK